MRCSYCHGRGHNKRACPSRIERLGKAEVDRRSGNHCSFCGKRGHTYQKCKLREAAMIWYDEKTKEARTSVSKIFEELGIGLGSIVIPIFKNGWITRGDGPESPILTSLSRSVSVLKNPGTGEELDSFSAGQLGGTSDYSITLPVLLHIERNEQGNAIDFSLKTREPENVKSIFLASFEDAQQVKEGTKLEMVLSLISGYADKNDNVCVARLLVGPGHYEFGGAVILPSNGPRLVSSATLEEDRAEKKRLFQKQKGWASRTFRIEGYTPFRIWKNEKEAAGQ